MVDRKLLQASLFLTLLVALGSPVDAQLDGSSKDSDRLFQQTPESTVALIESAEIAARLNRTLIARGYLQNVLDRNLSHKALVQLRDDVGIDVVLGINANSEMQPQARQLLESINRASAADLQAIESAPELVQRLGTGRLETMEAVSDLMKIGGPAAIALLAADPTSESGRLALQLLRRNPRLFRKGIVAGLPQLSPVQQVHGLQVVAGSADSDLAPLLLGYQFHADDEAVRAAAARAVQRLWDSGEPPQTSDEAIAWLIRKALGQLRLSADRFQGNSSQAVQAAVRLSEVAVQIDPQDEAANAALVACRAAALPLGEGEFPVNHRQRALLLALQAGNGAATEALLDDDPDHLIQAMDLPAPSVRIKAAAGLTRIDRDIRGKSRAEAIVVSAGRGSQLPEAVVIDPREDIATLGLNLLNDHGYAATGATTGQHGFDAAVAGLQCELIMIHTNCLRWPLTQTIANLRADVRTSQTPIVVYGPARDQAAVRSLQTRYSGVWFLQGPVSELNFANDLRRLDVPGPRLTEAARASLIQLALNANDI
jgi:hypothetical protein